MLRHSKAQDRDSLRTALNSRVYKVWNCVASCMTMRFPGYTNLWPSVRRLVRRPLTTEVRIRSLAISYRICGGQSGIGTGFSIRTLVSSYRYDSHQCPMTICNRRYIILAADVVKYTHLKDSCCCIDRQHCCFMLGGSGVQIPVRRRAIVVLFVVFVSPSRKFLYSAWNGVMTVLFPFDIQFVAHSLIIQSQHAMLSELLTPLLNTWEYK
jgi:hypothetical protein